MRQCLNFEELMSNRKSDKWTEWSQRVVNSGSENTCLSACADNLPTGYTEVHISQPEMGCWWWQLSVIIHIGEDDWDLFPIHISHFCLLPTALSSPFNPAQTSVPSPHPAHVNRWAICLMLSSTGHDETLCKQTSVQISVSPLTSPETLNKGLLCLVLVPSSVEQGSQKTWFTGLELRVWFVGGWIFGGSLPMGFKHVPMLLGDFSG
jgi:hypothetical protein